MAERKYDVTALGAVSYTHLDVYKRQGKEVLNDVTMEDAIQTGLTKMVPVIENGTGIAGTVLEKISKEARCV